MVNKKRDQWAPLLLRLIIGYGFMAHGFVKLSRGTAGFEKLLAQTGVPFSHMASRVVPFVELLGGLAILTGVFVNIVAIPLIITMLVALFTVQFKYGFSSVNTVGLTSNGPLFGPPGYEINLLYIAGLISLILSGGGAFSVDPLIHRKKKTKI